MRGLSRRCCAMAEKENAGELAARLGMLKCLGGAGYEFWGRGFLGGYEKFDRERLAGLGVTPEEMEAWVPAVPRRAVYGMKRYIRLRNGFYDSENKVVVERPEGEYTIVCWMDVERRPDAYDGGIDRWLDALTNGDGKMRAAVEEVLGECLTTSGKLTKMNVVIGGGGFMKMLIWFLGHWNVFNTIRKKTVGKLEAKKGKAFRRLAVTGDGVDFSKAGWRNLIDGLLLRGGVEGLLERRRKGEAEVGLNTVVIRYGRLPPAARFERFRGFLHFLALSEIGFGDELKTAEAKSYLFELAVKGRERVERNGHRYTASWGVVNAVSRGAKRRLVEESEGFV